MSDLIEQQLRTMLANEADSIFSGGDPVPAIERRMHQRARRHAAVAVAAVITVAVAAVGVLATVGQNGRDNDDKPIERPTNSIQPASGMDRAFLLDLDTGQATLLPLPHDGSFGYDVSPDGSQLAYSLWPDPGGSSLSGVYVSHLGDDLSQGATDTRRVTPPGLGAFGPHWSPDGTELVYQRISHFQAVMGSLRTGELFVVDVATGQTTRLTNPGISMYLEQDWFMSPSFSPDGRTILFHRVRSKLTGWDLWSVPATGGRPSLLRRNAAYGSYSPDGDTIAYTDAPQNPTPDKGTHPIPGYGPGESPAHSIQLADTDGSNSRPLVEGDQIRSPSGPQTGPGSPTPTVTRRGWSTSTPAKPTR
jgi:Tol biopolymer transport system component